MSGWRPKPKPEPTWQNFNRFLLEYQKNCVTVVENFVNLGYGCLYLLRNRGLLWRNFQTETEKFVPFLHMQSYRIVSDTSKGSYFLVEVKVPIVAAHDDKMQGKLQTDRRIMNVNGATTEEDLIQHNQSLSVSMHFILEIECDLRELQWFVSIYWSLWVREGGEVRPSDEELYPPCQFDDPAFPKRIDWNGEIRKREERTQAKYEARVKYFGPPKVCNEGLTGRHLVYQEFRVKQFSYRVNGGGGMQAIVGFYESLPPGGYWWGPRKDKEGGIDPDRFADSSCGARSNV